MRNILTLVVLLLAVVSGFLVWTMLPFRVTVTEMSLPAQFPPQQPPAGMSLSILPTGKMIADEMSAYRGGSPLRKYDSGMAAVLIRHPRGDLLIDSGFGSKAPEHVLTTPLLMQLMASAEYGVPAAQQLQTAGYDLDDLKGIVLTHAHWDHVSGLPDFAGTPVWVNEPERQFIIHGDEHSALARSMTGTDWQVFEYTETPYMGFPNSLDWHGDGSVVLVPLNGHTPGSTGVFIHLPSGKRYFLIGDLAWMIEGIERPAERPFLARRMVDGDPLLVRQMLGHVHQLARQFPDLVVVPAHDARVHARMPAFPDSES